MGLRIAASVLFVCAALACAAQTTEKVTASVFCSLNHAKAESCQMSTWVDQEGVHHKEFAFGKNRMVFTGTSQTGWWSGKLDGQPAMGYELNRGHVVYSTVDLKTTLEWYTEANQHGSY